MGDLLFGLIMFWNLIFIKWSLELILCRLQESLLRLVNDFKICCLISELYFKTKSFRRKHARLGYSHRSFFILQKFQIWNFDGWTNYSITTISCSLRSSILFFIFILKLRTNTFNFFIYTFKVWWTRYHLNLKKLNLNYCYLI